MTTGQRIYTVTTIVWALVLLAVVDHPVVRVIIGVALFVASTTLGMALEARPANRKDPR